MKKRTYGSGSFKQVSNGKYRLIYKKREHWVEAKNDREADRKLAQWVDQIDAELKAGPDCTVNRLLDLHIADLRRNKRKRIGYMILGINKHLRPFLGERDARMLRTVDIKRYVDDRIKRNPKEAYGSINRSLAALKRAYRLGMEDELVTSRPTIKLLPEAPPRQGFVELETYRAVLSALPPRSQLIWTMSYYTGVRKGELLNLLWDWVDFAQGVIVLPETVTKNKKRRTIPIYGDMRPLMEMAYQSRDPKCPFLFQHKGEQLRVHIQEADLIAVRENLKIPNLLFHDLRRTAIRNMEREGIPRRMGMQVSGHITESVYTRYSITVEKDAQEVGRRMAVFHQREKEKLLGNLLGDENDEGKEIESVIPRKC